MKNTLLFATFLSFSLAANAQLTLNSTNAPTVAKCQQNDTLMRLKMSGIVPSFAGAANATWDLTVMGDSTSFFYDNGPYSGSAFPTATFTQPGAYPFSSLIYYIDAIYDVTPTGIINYGEHIERQALSLAGISGATTDTLTFLQQDITYTSNPKDLKYPCTMGTTWTEIIPYVTNFELTILAFGLDHTPGERRSHLTRSYNVIGWGKMRVNTPSGPSAYMDVLEIEISHLVIDSFYLGGAPAPESLLSAFGTTQGQVSETNYRRFYRAGELRELARVTYSNNTYSSIQGVFVHKQRLPMPTTSIADNDMERSFVVYPNPVTGTSFKVDIENAGKSATYRICNLLGQEVAIGAVSANGMVSIDDSIPSGNYVIKILTEEGYLKVSQLRIEH
jgi:hypothetical protein